MASGNFGDTFEQSGLIRLDVSVRALVSQILLAAGQMTGSITVSMALSNRRNTSRQGLCG